MSKKHIAFTLLATLGLAMGAGAAVKADYQTVPKPASVSLTGQAPFILKPGAVAIVVTDDTPAMRRNAEFLSEYLATATGHGAEITADKTRNGAIVLVNSHDSAAPESWAIEVGSDKVVVSGGDDAGVFYGIQQLRKSLPAKAEGDIELPSGNISGSPRFSYRGAHFDTSRHFFTVDDLKTYLDMMALHGMNRFHWHITDDQGWRLEIKKHPRLALEGAVRPQTVVGAYNSGVYDGTPHGGYYTQDEARELVKYAAERYITIIPEIDLPGHMQAVLKVYPNLGCTGGPYELWTTWGVSDDVLCAGNPDTYAMLEDIYSELIDIFPSEYIHVGGDECPKVRWKDCPKCQAKIKELGIKGDDKHTAEEYLQSHVITHMEKFLNAHGRNLIGWDEILEGGLAPNSTVMSWRGIGGGIEAARQGHDVIMVPTSYLYLDYYQTDDIDNEPRAFSGYVPVERVYSFEPVPEELTAEESRHIIGLQGNLWTEYVPNFRHAEYMLLPRWAALSEVQWIAPEAKDYADFTKRLPRLIDWYDAEGYNYATHVFDVKGDYRPDMENSAIEVTLYTIDPSTIRYTLDGTEPDANSPVYTAPLRLTSTTSLRAKAFRDNGRDSRVLREEFKIGKATAKPVTANQPVNKQYSYKGVPTLVDGLRGGAGCYRTGRWIAFYGNDMDVTVDLGESQDITSAGFTACVVKGDWVMDARDFSVEVSTDGTTFTEVAREEYPALTLENQDGIYEHKLNFKPVEARYVRFKATPEPCLPEWHGGHGYPGFLFVDEITVD